MEHASMLSQSKNLFRDPTKPQVSDVYIAIMGVTGAGKSTFISQLADSQVPVGTGLYACTQDVAVYRCKYNGPVNIWLVDTPGFDDTHRSDTDVLREIANWLMESFSSKKVILNGIIYLHRITDIRMQGSAMKNLFMFKKLCGPDALKNVILATTMWERVSLEDGERREQELEHTSEFWGEMIMRGAQVKRHQNTADSAWSLVDIFASKSSTKRKTVLTIQQEMVVQHKTLDKTDAGIELESSLIQEREKWTRELERTRDDMREALAAKDKESLEQLRETEAKMNKKIDEIERAREELKIDMQQQYEDQISKLQTALEQRTLDSEDTKKQLRDMEKTLVEIQQWAETNVSTKDVKIDMQQQYEDQISKLQKALEKQTLDSEDTKKQLQKMGEIVVKMQQWAKTDEPIDEPQRPPVRPQFWKPGDDSNQEPDSLATPQNILEGESYKSSGTEKYTLSISGDRYFFCGPRYRVWRMEKALMFNHTGFVEVMRSYITTHVCFGSNGSYYHYWSRKNGHSSQSTNFKLEYPSLYRHLNKHIRHDSPTAVALGAHGHYFFATDEYKLWKLPSEIKAITEPLEIKQLWLGRNNAFVLVTESGTINFNLKGHYGSLSETLRRMKAKEQSIQALALDLEHDRYFIMYKGSSRATHLAKSHPDKHFLNQNGWR